MKNADSNERMWATLCHLSSLSIFIGIPFGNILGPLITWLIKKDEYDLVYDQGREALNFQVTVTITAFAIALLGILVIALSCFIMPIAFITIPIGILSGIAFTLIEIIFPVRAALRANKGERYRYPFSLKLF